MQDFISSIQGLCVHRDASFRHAVELINESRSGVAFVVDEKNRLVGIMTDGDIRRAVLKGVALDAPVSDAMKEHPISVTVEHTKGEVMRIFSDKKIAHLPVIDSDGVLVGVVYEVTLRREGVLDVPVVIMAGGFGKRLQPMTETVPKPMLKVGDKPMLEHLIERFRGLGVTDFIITTNYLANVIEDYFGDGNRFRVNVRYIHEDEPLGTAGSLCMLQGEMTSEFFVINADVLTDLDFRGMHNFHLERNSEMTVAVRKHEVQVPYGVLSMEQDRVVGISEKPVFYNYINAGIYVLAPSVLSEIPQGKYFDMPDLIDRLLTRNCSVAGFLVDGSWIDIGRPQDYHAARRLFLDGQGKCE